MHFDKLKWGIDPEGAKTHVSEQRRISMLNERTAIAEVRDDQRMLVARKAQGLSPVLGRWRAFNLPWEE